MNIDAVTLKALTQELTELLAGSTIQKISHLNKCDLAQQLRHPGQTYRLLIQLGNGQSNLRLTADELPPAQVPSSLVMQLRKHLQGQRLLTLEQPDLARTVYLRTARNTLVLELSGRRNNALLLNDQEIIMGKMLPEPPHSRLWLVGQRFVPQKDCTQPDALAASTEELRCGLIDVLGQSALQALTRGLFGLPPWHAQAICHSVGLDPEETLNFAQLPLLLQGLDIWRQRLLCGPYDPVVLGNGKVSPWSLGGEDEQCYADISQALSAERKLPGLEELRQEMLRTIAKMKNKRSRTLDKMVQEQERAQDNSELMEWGNLILAYMGQIKPQDSELHAYNNAGEPVTIMLMPELSPSENAQRYFKEYKRLKRARESTQAPIERMRQELGFIDDMELAIQEAATIQELEEAKAIWQQEYCPQEAAAKKAKRINAPALGPRRFKHRNFTILVGRNPRQNDQISTKIAAPGDVWLHTLRVPGAHVLIRAAGGHPTQETIAAAAHLAAKHSHASLDHKVEVIYTDAKYVHKVKGCQPGRVIVKVIKTIVASPHAEVEDLVEESRPQPIEKM